MGERKVQNKYYPPDFDPLKLYRDEKKEDRSAGGYVVRMMLPMTVQCDTCGEYLYIGTKFNMRKENLQEEYLGIQLFRFYMKCTRCSAEITIKTDPKNSDYICERGAKRHYEPWRDMESAVAAFKRKRLQEEEGDAMKSLENRTFDSKREMEILDTLNEVKLLNRRQANPDIDGMIKMVKQEESSVQILDQSMKEFKIRRAKRLVTEEVAKPEAKKNADPAQTQKQFKTPAPKSGLHFMKSAPTLKRILKP